MDRIVSKLKIILKEKSLAERYTWPFTIDENTLFTKEESSRITGDHFKSNLCLKELLHQKLNQDNKELQNLYFWIINSWGGIKGFKKTESNVEKIENFLKQLEEGEISSDSFSTISSLSKIASFVNPQKYFIYDARVIYSLNWLLLSTSTDKKQKYFPMPTGRNTKLANIDLKTIIGLSNKEISKENLYYSPQEAYHKYCEMILNINKKLSHQECPKPYYTEMLLFAIADNTILDEAREQISITLQSK